MPSIIGDIFQLLGITNSGVATSTVAPRVKSKEADELRGSAFDRDSEVSDPNVWHLYTNRMSMPRSLDEMMRMWDEMSNWDLMAAALVEIVDETIQQDQTTGKALWFECSDEKIGEELNELLDKLEVEDKLPSQVWHIAGYGNHFEKLQYEKGEGVMGLGYCHPMDVRRYWMRKNRRCVGFKYGREKPNKQDIWQQGDVKINRAVISAGGSTTDIEQLWYPWDFLHFRRMYRLRISEHGEPIFEEAQGIYKKLRMAIDQMVVHRAQVQPDRYVIGIDTQDQAPAQQLKTIQRWKQSLRSKQAYGSGGSPNELSTPNDFSSYYNPLALDTIFWLPKPKGVAHAIDKLAGTPTVPDVYDIELLLNLFFSIIGMPRSWLGGSQGGAEGQGPVSGKALLAQDIRFMRKVKSLRRPILSAYTWMAYFHCILKGYDITNVDITAKMSDIGTLEDQMKIEIFGQQVELLTKLGDFFDKYKLSPDSWLELIFKRYMHLPDELTNAVLTALPPQLQAQEGREGRLPAPNTTVLLRELAERLLPHRRLVDNIKRLGKILKEDPVSGKQLRESQCQAYPITDKMAAPRRLSESKIFETAAMESGVAENVMEQLVTDKESVQSPNHDPHERTRRYYGNGS